MTGWIGVDLDGTLAHYDGWKGQRHIGEPIAAMVERVRSWLAEGRVVKIFTARVAVPEPDRSTVIRVIHEWCELYGLPRLDITNVKDIAMAELWDDRAVQVISNTGRPVSTASLRDEFAMNAPVGFDEARNAFGSTPELGSDGERAAFFAVWTLLRYEYADAMLHERAAAEAGRDRASQTVI